MASHLAAAQLRDTTAGTEHGLGLTLLTVEAAAARLSIGRTTMYALIKSGHVTTVQIGRLRRVPAEALADYTARLIAEQHAA